jgi:hypothetical protein
VGRAGSLGRPAAVQPTRRTRLTQLWRGRRLRPAGQPGYGYPQPTQQYDPNFQQYGTEPAWSAPPEEPPRKKRFSPVLVLVIVLAVLVCGGGAAAVWFVGRPDDTKALQTAATADPSVAAPSAQPTTSPNAESSADARFVKKGQCVKNVGSTDDPKLEIAKCATKTYQVLARFDEATTGQVDAEKKCKDVEGYTDWYFFDSPLDLNDYVLCLKAR